MIKMLYRFATPLLGVGCLIMLVLIVTNRELPSPVFVAAHLKSFKILFISIILEAFPFIILGVLFSALLQVFITDEHIKKFTPKNPIAGILFGSMLGLLFPLCECGMIPVVRRLIRKGMPAYIGIVYLLAGPIVNPIVFISTFTAFRTTPEMAYSRMGLAFAVAVIIGLLLYKFMTKSPLKPAAPFQMIQTHSHNHQSNHHATRGKIGSILSHASDEFFEMGKYFIFGALLTAILQSVIARSTFEAFADQSFFSYLFMMAFAYILSICSTSDAFIASSFSGIFDFGPLLAFLVFGPMIDLKSTLMLLSTFRIKFVLILISLTASLTLAGALIMEVMIR